MKALTIRSVALSLLALGLMATNSAYALEDGTAAKPQAKPASSAPVSRTVKFKSDEAVRFKQRLEIYNRAKASSEKLYCREDRMTGSHRKKMRCVTMATKELEEDAARAFFRALR